MRFQDINRPTEQCLVHWLGGVKRVHLKNGRSLREVEDIFGRYDRPSISILRCSCHQKPLLYDRFDVHFRDDLPYKDGNWICVLHGIHT